MTNRFGFDTVEMMNTIRDNASDNYRRYVPEANLANYAEVGNPIIEYSSVGNEFLHALVNKIAMTIVDTKIFKNPLAILKKGYNPLGADIEDIMANPATAKPYTGDSTSVFKRTIPDIKAAYYRLNRQDKYPVTVSNEQLTKAFTSWNALENLIGEIVNSMYNGDNIDEFTMIKQLITSAIAGGNVRSITTTDPSTSEASAKTFAKMLRSYSGKFRFPSAEYNTYEKLAGSPAITYTPADKIVLILPVDTLAALDVDVLAMAFNMDKAEFMGRIIEVDYLPTGIYGMMCDEGWFQIYDNLTKMTEIYNPDNLSWNYWYHRWETIAYRPWANAVVFASSTTGTASTFTIDPVSPTVTKGTSQQFNSTVTGSGSVEQGATWSITTTGINANTSIDSKSGLLYVSPDETKTAITIKAISVEDTSKTATTNVTII